MLAEFISPRDPRWEKFLLTTPHDFYHLPQYVQLCAKHEGATAAAFYAENSRSAFLVPLLIRSIPSTLGAPEGWFDCVSPYGYSTPLVGPSLEGLQNFLEAFSMTARRSRIVTAFLRLHPLLPLNHEVLGKFGRVTKHGQTVYIDLTKSAEEIWRQTREDHRTDIRKLGRLGFKISLDDWSLYDDFIALYYLTMKRVGAQEGYLFSPEYFEDFRTVLGDHLHLCCVLSPDGELASAGTYVDWGGIVQGHLAGTAAKFFSAAPSKLMQHSMREWAKERSNKVFHMGGGVGAARDSLFEFKAGFSKERAEFFTCRLILDEPMNDVLVGLAAACRGKEFSSTSDYFPAYRQP